MSKYYISKVLILLFLIVGMVSCSDKEGEEKEIVPAPEISFESTETSTSSGLSVEYTNTSKNADPKTYQWTIQYIGVNSPDEIAPQLVFESTDKDISYNYTKTGYYRVTLFGSNSNGFGTESSLTRY